MCYHISLAAGPAELAARYGRKADLIVLEGKDKWRKGNLHNYRVIGKAPAVFIELS